MLELQPDALQLGLDLRQSLLFIISGLLGVDFKERGLHLESTNVRALSNRRSFVIFWHLDHQKLLVRYSHDPELSNQMPVFDLKIMARSPRLRCEAKRSNDTKGVKTEQLTFLAKAKPVELAGGSHGAVSIKKHTIIPS